MERKVIRLSNWQRSAEQATDDDATAGSARICQHCHGKHTEDYLCPELLFAHGLPSRVASQFTQIRT